jgi:hypothetical protein
MNRGNDHDAERERLKALRLLEFRAKAHCGDCDAPHGMYMLRDEVWLQINDKKKKGVLCIGCAARRLGRPFTRNDFTSAPCNDVIFYASTMRSP